MKRVMFSIGLSAIALASTALVTGCAADRGANVPVTAEMMAEGNGSVSAQAPHDGTVYVYDSVSSQLVYSGPVARGATVAVDRPNDQITVDGKVVQDKTPNIAYNHRIFFDRQVNGTPTY